MIIEIANLVAEGGDTIGDEVGVNLQLGHHEQGGGQRRGDDQGQQGQLNRLLVFFTLFVI